MKRPPTLADLFLASKLPLKGGYYRPIHIELQRKITRARKFVFDGDASRRVAEVIRTIPEILIDQAEFARPPFDLTWIEFNHDRVWSELNPPHMRSTDAGKDFLLGYLIDHSSVYVIASDKGGATVMIPMKYCLNTVWPHEKQLRMAEVLGISRMQLDMVLWGSSYTYIPEDKRRFLRDRNSVEAIGADEIAPDYEERVFKAVLRNSAGDLRNVIALMLMLNRPSVSQFEEVPRGRGSVGNRFVPYTAYNNVTISLNAVPILKLIGTPGESGVTKRRHEVRGHFCQNRESRWRGCVHNWNVTAMDEDVPNFPIRWECTRCLGKRWWKHAHERGDASKGFVTKQYTVTE